MSSAPGSFAPHRSRLLTIALILTLAATLLAALGAPSARAATQIGRAHV